MSSIELPDPVITWEVEETFEHTKRYVSTFIVRAMVGGLAIFERRYQDDDGHAGDTVYAYDLADAKQKAAREFAKHLQWVLRGSEEADHYARLEENEMRETYG